jgi:TRAP-type uncharacterized transport system fused permease subunit
MTSKKNKVDVLIDIILTIVSITYIICTSFYLIKSNESTIWNLLLLNIIIVSASILNNILVYRFTHSIYIERINSIIVLASIIYIIFLFKEYSNHNINDTNESKGLWIMFKITVYSYITILCLTVISFIIISCAMRNSSSNAIIHIERENTTLQHV